MNSYSRTHVNKSAAKSELASAISRKRALSCSQIVASAALCGVFLAACGSSDRTSVANDNAEKYNISRYFDNLAASGANYSMVGSFERSTGAVAQRHEINRSSFAQYEEPWQGRTNLGRSLIQVDRFEDGEAGASDTYSVYYTQDYQYVGMRAKDYTWYQTADGIDSRPVFAAIGESGVRNQLLNFPDDATSHSNYLLTTWTMSMDDNGTPKYCELTRDFLAESNTQNWEYEWCFGIEKNGDPTGFISYSYWIDPENYGEIVATNLALNSEVVIADPDTAPPGDPTDGDPEINPGGF